MKKIAGVIEPRVMKSFPSGTATDSFASWIPNHAGLEQVLGVAGFLTPDFYEVSGCTFWSEDVARKLEGRASTLLGEDRTTLERKGNLLNLEDFFLMAADSASATNELVATFGHVLEKSWGQALERAFPDRCYEFEIGVDLLGEVGLCLTFWRQRTLIAEGENLVGH